MYYMYIPLDETLYLESPDGGWIPTGPLDCHLFDNKKQAQEVLDNIAPHVADKVSGFGKKPRIKKMSDKEIVELVKDRENRIKELYRAVTDTRRKLTETMDLLGETKDDKDS